MTEKFRATEIFSQPRQRDQKRRPAPPRIPVDYVDPPFESGSGDPDPDPRFFNPDDWRWIDYIWPVSLLGACFVAGLLTGIAWAEMLGPLFT